jgi:DNA polymerase III epsilon subunit-like protein
MIIVDFETTGLLSSNPNPEAQPGIVQIGLIELDAEWRETNEQCVLINPEKAIEPDAARTHGITSQNVAGAPTLVALLPDLADIFRRHTTWVGFNNSFDRNVLWHQLLRYNWGQRFPWPSRDLDIMKVSRDVVNIAGKQDVKYPKLEELHHHLFGTKFDMAHDAMADCQATLRCARKLVEMGYL